PFLKNAAASNTKASATPDGAAGQRIHESAAPLPNAGTCGKNVGRSYTGGSVRDLRRQVGAGLCVIVAVVGALAVRAQKPIAEWRYYGGDKAFTRYSPLAQITRDNVKNLKIAWRRPAVDSSLTQAFPDLRVSAFLKATPIVIDGVLYTPNAHGLITAFDGATGATKWEQEPFARTPDEIIGQATRG